MSMQKLTKFIKDSGGCLVSRSIIDGRGHIKWVRRERFVNPVDIGWRILSDIDTDDFLNEPGSLIVASFNSTANFGPALIGIYNLPVGADLQLVVQDGRHRWHDNATGQDITNQLLQKHPERNPVAGQPGALGRSISAHVKGFVFLRRLTTSPAGMAAGSPLIFPAQIAVQLRGQDEGQVLLDEAFLVGLREAPFPQQRQRPLH